MNLLKKLAFGAGIMAALAAPAKAQETTTEPSGSLKSNVLVERDGVNSQNILTYSLGDKLNTTAKVAGHVDVGETHTAGIDVKNDLFRINVGARAHPRDSDSQETRALGTIYGQDGLFLGGKFQSLTDQDRWSVFAGYDVANNLTLEATAGDGGQRGTAIWQIDDNQVASIGGGVNEHGTGEMNLTYGNPHALSIIQFGNKPFDGKIIIGSDIDANVARYAAKVTASGINELNDDFGDATFPFDIGTDPAIFHEYFAGNTFFLGRDAGDWAVEARVKEGGRAYIDTSVRAGSLGPIEDIALRAGLYSRLADDSFDKTENGVRGGIGFNVGLFTFNGNVAINEDGKDEYTGFVGLHYEF